MTIDSSSTETSNQQPASSSKGFTIFVSIMALILVAGGWQMAAKYYKDITSSMPDDYSAITNQDTPTFALFKDKLAKEGITPDISEMSVFLMTEAAYKYKWQRGDDMRVYVIRRNASGVWDTYPQ